MGGGVKGAVLACGTGGSVATVNVRAAEGAGTLGVLASGVGLADGLRLNVGALSNAAGTTVVVVASTVSDARFLAGVREFTSLAADTHKVSRDESAGLAGLTSGTHAHAALGAGVGVEEGACLDTLAGDGIPHGITHRVSVAVVLRAEADFGLDDALNLGGLSADAASEFGVLHVLGHTAEIGGAGLGGVVAATASEALVLSEIPLTVVVGSALITGECLVAIPAARTSVLIPRAVGNHRAVEIIAGNDITAFLADASTGVPLADRSGGQTLGVDA